MLSASRKVNAGADKRPEYAYHLLRSALECFKKSIPELNAEQYKEVTSLADRTYALESIVLSSSEAIDVSVADVDLENAVSEISSRYSDQASFIDDLNRNGIDEEVLRSALRRELLFDAVMDRVSSRIPAVNELDIQIFYQLHAERFIRPETRKVSHILITVNDEFPENTYQRVLERMRPMVEKLRSNPARFRDLAKKHSECPSALEGGKLGETGQGKLYPELDSALFAMTEGEVSDIIETELGLHILYCEKIQRGVKVPYARAKTKIQRILEQRQRKACQKAWLDKLKEDD